MIKHIIADTAIDGNNVLTSEQFVNNLRLVCDKIRGDGAAIRLTLHDDALRTALTKAAVRCVVSCEAKDESCRLWEASLKSAEELSSQREADLAAMTDRADLRALEYNAMRASRDAARAEVERLTKMLAVFESASVEAVKDAEKLRSALAERRSNMAEKKKTTKKQPLELTFEKVVLYLFEQEIVEFIKRNVSRIEIDKYVGKHKEAKDAKKLSKEIQEKIEGVALLQLVTRIIQSVDSGLKLSFSLIGENPTTNDLSKRLIPVALAIILSNYFVECKIDDEDISSLSSIMAKVREYNL